MRQSIFKNRKNIFKNKISVQHDRTKTMRDNLYIFFWPEQLNADFI